MVFHNGPEGIRYNRINFQITLVHFPLLKIIFIGLSNLWKQFQSNCMKSFQKHWWALWASRDWAGWNCYPVLYRVSGVHVHGFFLSSPSVHLPFPWPCSLLAEPWHNSFIVVIYLFLVSYFKDFIFLTVLDSPAKLALKDRDFPYIPCPHVCTRVLGQWSLHGGYMFTYVFESKESTTSRVSLNMTWVIMM